MSNEIQELLDALQVVLDEEPDVYPDRRRSTLREAMKWLSYYQEMLAIYQEKIIPGLSEKLEKRVEVVRCKDCEYFEAEECVNPYIFMSDGAHLYTGVNDFCNHGERKDNG